MECAECIGGWRRRDAPDRSGWPWRTVPTEAPLELQVGLVRWFLFVRRRRKEGLKWKRVRVITNQVISILGTYLTIRELSNNGNAGRSNYCNTNSVRPTQGYSLLCMRACMTAAAVGACIISARESDSCAYTSCEAWRRIDCHVAIGLWLSVIIAAMLWYKSGATFTPLDLKLLRN